METIKKSTIYKLLIKLVEIIESSVKNSYVYDLFTRDKSTENIMKESVFSKVIYIKFSILRKIFYFLKLDKIFTGSIFANTYIWVILTIAMAPFLPTMAILGLVLACLLSFIIKVCLDKDFVFRYSPINIWIILFVIIYIFSALTSLNVISSFKIALVILSFILFYFVIINTIDTKEKFNIAILVFVIAGTLVALYGIYEYVTINFFGTKYVDKELFSDIKTRVESTFGNPNVLGEYLLFVIPISVSMFFGYKGWLKKLIFGITTLIMTICLAITYSRGCYLGLLLAAGIFVLLLNFRFIILFLAGLVAIPFVLPESIIRRFASIGNMTDSSTTYRISIWKGSIDMIKDYWYKPIGQGAEAFNSIYPLYAYSGVGAEHSHNLFLQLVIELGILGLVMFLGIIFKFYQYLLSGIKNCKDKMCNLYLIGFVSAMSGYIVQGIFDNTWYNLRTVLIFWIFIALGVKVRELVNDDIKEVHNAKD